MIVCDCFLLNSYTRKIIQIWCEPYPHSQNSNGLYKFDSYIMRNDYVSHLSLSTIHFSINF